MLKFSKKNFLVLTLIFVFSLILRLWFNTNVCFHTDQSRDAIIANKIIAGDWQLFGPVVSGGGALFHGVLYYYVLAPLYLIGKGSPLFVNLFLAALTTLAIFPTFILSKKILKKDFSAYLAVFLSSFSFSTIQHSGSFWNLILSTLILPFFVIFCLEIYDNPSKKNFFFVGLLLGLLVQSGLSNLQWLLPVAIIIFLIYKNKKNDNKDLFINLIVSFLAFIFTISSMILVEFLALKRGLFKFNDSLHWLNVLSDPSQSLENVTRWSFNNLSNFISPYFFPELITLFFIGLTIYVFKKTKLEKNYKLFFIFLIPPFLSQFLTNWGASYTLTGYESIFYIFVVIIFRQIYKKIKHLYSQKLINFGLSLLLLFFLISNFAAINYNKQNHLNFNCMLDVDWSDKLEVIDYTYNKAAGKPFSIDVVAEPYGINTTYGYLYSWYGQREYGYKPIFTGLSQDGLDSQGLLLEGNIFDEKNAAHFVIHENGGTYDYWFKKRSLEQKTNQASEEIFYYRQPSLTFLEEEKAIGKIDVEYYKL